MKTSPIAPEIRAQLTSELGEILAVSPVGGGCVSSAFRLDLNGKRIFLKVDVDAPEGFFAAEVDGLERLAAAGTGIRIPSVLAHAESDSGSWLALEWLEEEAGAPAISWRLGRGLAHLHRNAGRRWGWSRDGFIGTLPQANPEAITWAEFWRDARIRPQLERSRKVGDIGTDEEWSELEARLPSLLRCAEDEAPSLLHGDLWSGNVMAVDGVPALVDPASYYGHREVDLAMAQLFGGFDQEFYDGYSAEWPLAAGYEIRRHVYQLYYLLVHVNLFGRSYIPATIRALRQVVAR